MRLLVFDEEFFSGGVETLREHLLPALARRCELLVWAVPDHLVGDCRARLGGVPNLVIESHQWPSVHLGRVTEKIAGLFNKERAAAASRDRRIATIAHRHGCECLLATCVFSQPVPRIALPLYGFVCDVNPAIPEPIRNNIAAWVTASTGTFAISDFTRSELQRMQPACAEKIHSIPLAAPPLKSWNPKPVVAREFDFYYPAALNPHKNHLLLFQACASLAESGRKFRLALGGPGSEDFRSEASFANPEMDEARRYLRAHPSLSHVVKVIGGVPPAEIAALYENTRCVVLPSSYEGFGLPLAEALQRGLPVICSDIPPFLEQIRLHGSPSNVQVVPVNNATRLTAAMDTFLAQAGDPAWHLPPPPPPWSWEEAAARCFELLSRPHSDAKSAARD